MMNYTPEIYHIDKYLPTHEVSLSYRLNVPTKRYGSKYPTERMKERDALIGFMKECHAHH